MNNKIIYASLLVLSAVYIPCSLYGMADQELAQKFYVVSESLKACESHVPLGVHLVPDHGATPAQSLQVPRDEAIAELDQAVKALLRLQKRVSVAPDDGNPGMNMIDGELMVVEYQTSGPLQWD